MISRFLLLAALSGVFSAQAAISFQFTYTDIATGFNDATQGQSRRTELESAASHLGSYFITNQPITLTYTVNSIDEQGSYLAAAGSDLISTAPGFHSTVVQNKILTGVDTNSTTADGEIFFNFAYDWGYGSMITSAEYDFYSTALHEVLHSFGFASMLSGNGTSTDERPSGTPDSWSIYDSFMTTSDGTFLVDHTAFGYNTAVGLSPLTSGMFFSGSNAVAAYEGNLVPLYTPAVFAEGSSATHLDDATFTSTNPAALNAMQLMNAATDTGLGVRILSDLEMGILKDLNYNIVPEPGTWALLLLGGGFVVALRLRRRKIASSLP